MSTGSQLKRAVLTLGTLSVSALTLSALSHAGTDPRGIWYDHNGRGAVEIKECASNAKRLCGHVVYVKKARNKKRCGMQIIGNVRGNGRGWIYSPKRGRSFPLAMKRLSNNRLRIVGNAGSFFTKTYIWKRAPDSIVNCENAIVAKKKAKPVAKPVVTAAAKPVTPTKTDATPAPANTPPASESNNTSSATAALISRTRVSEPEVAEAQPEPVAAAAETTATEETATNQDEPAVDDLSPPGGLSNGGDEKLGKLKSVIDKFTGGKGIKGIKLSGKRKCNFRIPYVGRTIKVPCK